MQQINREGGRTAAGKDFVSSNHVDGVFYFNYRALGVRDDKTVKFYEIGKEGPWVNSPIRDFVSPDDIDGAFNFADGYMGIRGGKTVKVYSLNSAWNCGLIFQAGILSARMDVDDAYFISYRPLSGF